MFRHFVQWFAGELAALLLGLRIGVVCSPVHIARDFPAEGGLHTPHVGFVHVDAIADEIIAVTANRTGGIGTAVTAANFRNFVLEVGIKQRHPGIQVIVVIPEQGELFAQALLWFQF